MRLGDCLDVLPTLEAGSVHCCVTSPPYWSLRDYGVDGQLGLEPTPEEYVAKMVEVFREVRRVLRDDGTLWLNLGDSYASGTNDSKSFRHDRAACNVVGRRPSNGLKPKDLVGIPWMVAFALRADGWYLRSDIIWHKPNPMPESCTDRPTKSHEYLFLLTKSPRYFYDADAIREVAEYGYRPTSGPMFSSVTGPSPTDKRPVAPRTTSGGDPSTGRNKRSVWTIATQPFTGWQRTYRLARVERDAVSGGMTRIESEGCSVHGRLDRQCDEHADSQSSHNQRTDHHEQVQPDGSLRDSPSHEKAPLGCGPDCSALDSSQTATPHSNQSHKTGHVSATNSACKPCGETDSHTSRTSTSQESVDSQTSIPDSKTWPNEMDVHLPDQSLCHIVRTSSLPIPSECTCSFYQKVTKKTSHFATFPEALVLPCILAGTSEEGCCAGCGAPYVRVTEREQLKRERPNDRTNRHEQGDGVNSCGNTVAGVDVKTIGWECTCGCVSKIDKAVVPCTVLDPFLGSGTVAKVSQQYGRSFVGCELSAEYLELARDRFKQSRLFA